MTELEAITKYPFLEKITTVVLYDVVLNKIGLSLNFNKSWVDNELSDLDCVEMVMEIEKRLDIHIPDEVVDQFYIGMSKPPRFLEYKRNEKINKILGEK